MWDQVGQALRLSMTKMLSQLASLLPGIVALLTALIFSVAVAWTLSLILQRSLARLDFDRRVARWGFPALAEWSPSSSPTRLVTRALAGIIIFIGFLIGISAFDGALPSQFVVRLFAYLPDVMTALVVLIAGNIIARFLARSVLIGAVNARLQYARFLSLGVKWLVLVLTAAMVLDHLQIGGTVVDLAFGILFGGIVLTLSLAVGLGSSDIVSRSLEKNTLDTFPGDPDYKPHTETLRHF